MLPLDKGVELIGIKSVVKVSNIFWFKVINCIVKTFGTIFDLFIFSVGEVLYMRNK